MVDIPGWYLWAVLLGKMSYLECEGSLTPYLYDIQGSSTQHSMTESRQYILKCYNATEVRYVKTPFVLLNFQNREVVIYKYKSLWTI